MPSLQVEDRLFRRRGAAAPCIAQDVLGLSWITSNEYPPPHLTSRLRDRWACSKSGSGRLWRSSKFTLKQIGMDCKSGITLLLIQDLCIQSDLTAARKPSQVSLLVLSPIEVAHSSRPGNSPSSGFTTSLSLHISKHMLTITLLSTSLPRTFQ